MTLRINLFIVGAIAAGIGFGMSMAIMVQGARDVSTPVRNESAETNHVKISSLKNSKVWKKTEETQLRNLQNQSSKLNRSIGEQKMEKGSDLVDREHDFSSINPAPPDPIEDWNRIQSEWQSKIQVHDTDSRDSAWAGAIEDRLWRDLEELESSVNFELESVDCRTTTCTTQTRWPSREAAKLGLGAMLSYDYQEGCGVEIVLPEEETETDSYLATVLILCERDI